MELWIALDMLRQDECPNCRIEPIDMMDYELVSVKCPTCKNEYSRVKKWQGLRGSLTKE